VTASADIDSVSALETLIEELSDADRVRFAQWASGFVTSNGMPGPPPGTAASDEHRIALRVRGRFARTGDGTISAQEAANLYAGPVMDAVWYEGSEIIYGLAWALATRNLEALTRLQAVRQRLAALAAERHSKA
jgi:hypothetical protein